MKIALGLPHQNERILAKFVDSLTGLIVHSLHQGVEIVRIATYRDNITFARNKISSKFLETDADYLFFLDDDMVFDPDTLIRLLKQDKEIVGGLTFIRSEPHEPSFYTKDSHDTYVPIYMWKKKALVECDAIGMASTLIKRSVFEKMKAVSQYHKNIYGFYDNIGFKGEDLSFCEKAKALKFKIHCDTEVLVGHLTDKVIGYGNYKAMADDSVLRLKKAIALKNYK